LSPHQKLKDIIHAKLQEFTKRLLEEFITFRVSGIKYSISQKTFEKRGKHARKTPVKSVLFNQPFLSDFQAFELSLKSLVKRCFLRVKTNKRDKL